MVKPFWLFGEYVDVRRGGGVLVYSKVDMMLVQENKYEGSFFQQSMYTRTLKRVSKTAKFGV